MRYEAEIFVHSSLQFEFLKICERFNDDVIISKLAFSNAKSFLVFAKNAGFLGLKRSFLQANTLRV